MTRQSTNKPRIYADFNKWEGDEESRWLVLTCKGTIEDLARLGVQVRDGLEVTFYTDDTAENGSADELEADGHVRFDAKANCWIGIIDWNAIRHASDRT